MTKYLLASMLFFLPLSAQAKCAEFQLDPGLAKVPIVAIGEVIASTPPEQLSACAKDGEAKCRYKFTVKVSRVLKGQVVNPTLNFDHGYWVGCPGIDTYKLGQNLIWLIEDASAAHLSKMYGTSCGRGGRALKDLPEVERILEQLSTQSEAAKVIQ